MRKAIMISFLFFSTLGCNTRSYESDNSTIDTGGDVSEYCLAHPLTAFCTDTRGKSPGELSGKSFVFLEFSTISGREDIPVQVEDNSKIALPNEVEWKAGWDLLVSEISDIHRLKQHYYVYRTNPEGGEDIYGRVIRAYYDQDGNRLTSFFYLTGGAGQSTLAADGVSSLHDPRGDFNTITEIYEMVFFGERVTNETDMDKADYYYVMPTIHLKRPSSVMSTKK